MSLTQTFIFIFILLVLNAFYSTAEFSIASSRKLKLQQLAASGNEKAQHVLELAANPTSFITVIQISLNVIAVLSGVFGEQSFSPILKEFFQTIGVGEKISEFLGVTIAVLFITTLFIIFAELLPKKMAFSKPEQVACMVINPLLFTLSVLKPFVWLLSTIADLILKLFKVSHVRDDKMTFEDVSAVISEGAQTGLFDKHEHHIIENVFSLTDRTVMSAMTIKNEIVYLDLNDSQEEIKSKLVNHPYSRFLVCDTNLDNMMGYIDSSNILKNMLSNKPVVFSRETLNSQGLKPILTIPDTLTLLDVLDKFRENRQDISAVINEFGNVVGLITLNDVLSTLMGNVVHNLDSPELIVQRAEDSWLIDGKAAIEDVKRLFGWDEIDGEGNFETISGFLMYKLKCFPKKAQTFEYKGIKFEIVDVDGYRIDEVMATIIRV